MNEHVRSIALGIVLTLVTCGLYNLFWQAKQMAAVNSILSENKYYFLPWLGLSVITCGIYHVYHEYRMSNDLARALGRDASNDGLIAILLSLFGLSLVVDAIQQAQINEHYGDESL